MSYKPGDLVLQEEPWLHTISAVEIDRRCYFCLKWLTKMDRKTGVVTQLLANNRCGGCKYAKYCSKNCQAKDWKERHKFECAALGRISSKGFSPPDHFLLMLKIIAKLTNPKCFKKDLLGPIPGQRTFSDLKSHMEQIRNDQEAMDYLSWMRNMIGVYLELKSVQMEMIPVDELFEIHGKIKCNTFVIEGSNFEQIGAGIYLRGSSFDHSCSANACQTFVGSRLSIRATKDISDIKSVRISYVDPFEPVRIRQQKLQKMYYFTCTCELCSDPAKDAERFSLKCLNSSCSAEIPSDERANKPCPKCRTKPPTGQDRLEDFWDVYSRLIEMHRKWNSVIEPTKTEMKEFEAFEKKLLMFLHPKNPLCAGFYIRKGFMLQGAGDPGWPKCFEKALELNRPWLSPVDPRIGWCAYFAADPRASNYGETLKKMDEAQKILSMTFGPDHEMAEEARNICIDLTTRLRGRLQGAR